MEVRKEQQTVPSKESNAGLWSGYVGSQRFGFRLRFQAAYDPFHLQYLRSCHDFSFFSARLRHR